MHSAILFSPTLFRAEDCCEESCEECCEESCAESCEECCEESCEECCEECCEEREASLQFFVSRFHISLCSRHGPENRKSCYIMLEAYTFCEECCEAPTLSVSRISFFQSPGFQARTCGPEELLYHASGLYVLRAMLRGSQSFSLQELTL